MSGPAPGAHWLWRYLPLPVVAVMVGVATAAVVSWSALDEVWYRTLLRTATTSEASSTVSLLTVSSRTVQERQCSETITRTLTSAGARAGLLLSPLDALCPPTHDVQGLDGELIPPVEVLDADVFIFESPTGVVGLEADSLTPLLDSLGVPPARWLRRRAADSVPTLPLERVVARELNDATLTQRVVLVSLADDEGNPNRGDRARAAALAAALETGPQRPLALWMTLLLAALACGAHVLTGWRWRAAARLKLGAQFGLGLSLSLGMLFGFAGGWLVPMPSLVLSLCGCWFVVELPRRIAAGRADRSAEQLLRKASRLLQMRAPPYLQEAEFWQNLARKASQAHPADEILVAELPPFSWRLKVWPNGELDESVIKERRRDIRRTPYASKQGVPVASVTEDYLVMKGVPTVLVPIVHHGDVEGYLMMLGNSAADYFTEHPMVAQNLADELAGLIRNRRQVLGQEANHRHPVGLPGAATAGASDDMLSGARNALGELQLMSAMVQGSPVGLCYADPFGDVRILGKAWLKWLPQLSIELAGMNEQGTLRPGQLGLRALIDSLTQQIGSPAPLLSGIKPDGLNVDIPLSSAQSATVNALRLHVVRLADDDAGGVGGFLATLIELPSNSHTMAPRASLAPRQHGDPLVVFSLARLVQRMVGNVGAEVRAKIRMQTPRDAAHVVAHRAELKDALQNFIVAAAKLAGKGAGPIIAFRELDQRVELRLLDLRLGAPVAALERAVLAPSAPPPGLNQLGALVRAVENSHGCVKIETDDSWGLELELSFVRARPRIENADMILEGLKKHNRPIEF
jgi:hypothetical protein